MVSDEVALAEVREQTGDSLERHPETGCGTDRSNHITRERLKAI